MSGNILTNRAQSIVGKLMSTFTGWWMGYYLFFLLVAGNSLRWIGESGVTDIALSTSLACIETVVLTGISLCTGRRCRPWVMGLWIAAVNIMIFVDVVMLMTFGYGFNESAYNIIRDTNVRESREFIYTYFSLGTVGLIIVQVIANYLLIKVSHMLAKPLERRWWIPVSAAAVMTVVFAGAVLLSKTGRTPNMPVMQYSLPTRFALPVIIPRDVYVTNSLIEQDKLLEGAVASNPADSTIYVVILGESQSYYHSRLCGYKYDTEPVKERLRSEGELLVYPDCISQYDYTGSQLKTFFSYADNDLDIHTRPLFPQVFKRAGYYTAMHDNQYKAEVPVVYYSTPELTASCFDYRVPITRKYDHQMIDSIRFDRQRALYIIHLSGEHYIYADRMPQTARREFDESHYSEFAPEHRQTIADYDNCIMYTDSLVGVIIDRLKDTDACVIYLSDHGEEVYETRDFMGHGSALGAPDPTYQFRIPLYIWGSDTFRQKPVWQRLQAACHRPVSSGNFSHFITDLAGISVPVLDRSRSFISDAYDIKRHRRVYKDIDYETQIAPLHKP